MWSSEILVSEFFVGKWERLKTVEKITLTNKQIAELKKWETIEITINELDYLLKYEYNEYIARLKK
jgi:hypothetical protein